MSNFVEIPDIKDYIYFIFRTPRLNFSVVTVVLRRSTAKQTFCSVCKKKKAFLKLTTTVGVSQSDGDNRCGHSCTKKRAKIVRKKTTKSRRCIGRVKSICYNANLYRFNGQKYRFSNEYCSKYMYYTPQHVSAHILFEKRIHLLYIIWIFVVVYKYLLIFFFYKKIPRVFLKTLRLRVTEIRTFQNRNPVRTFPGNAVTVMWGWERGGGVGYKCPQLRLEEAVGRGFESSTGTCHAESSGR